MADFYRADILIPKNIKDNWAVIACDQFTSDKEYWKRVEENIDGDISTFRLILPEAYLGESAACTQQINGKMREYLDSGIFETHSDSMIYVRRVQPDGKTRCGIVGTINLDDYDYSAAAKSVTRATEATAVDRLPPRVAVRKGAPLELPHVLVLIDDPRGTVIEPLEGISESPLYDLELMLGGGQIKGWRLTDAQICAVQSALDTLKRENDGFLFAVGDGNHSLAAAKECAAPGGKALVEIVNIHSPAIEFEPIYRVLFGCEPQAVIEEFLQSVGGEYDGADAQEFTVCFGENQRVMKVRPTAKLPVGTLQKFLDAYAAKNSSVEIDYIHGEEETKQLAKQPGVIGFIFEGITKNSFFEAIAADGSLPRKTFSMGAARDKRYYIEARQI